VAEEPVRRGLLLRTVMEILRDAGTKLSQSEVHDELNRRVQLNAQELSLDNSGLPRFDRAVGFHMGDAATIGWTSKIGGWSITDAGSEALDTFETPDELWSELRRQLRDVDHRRKEAQRDLNDVQQFIADAIALVEPSSWTSYADLAELAGTSAKQVADFLAAVKVANSYRVLEADGSIPPEGQLHFAYRGNPGLLERLTREGLAFGDDGRASQDQRLTSDALKERLRARAEETQEEVPAPAKRAWMVRGSSVDGYNLVPEWRHEGFVSLSASQLAGTSPDASYEELRQAVDEGYQHKSYAYREQRLAEFDRFIRRMRTGDLVLTTEHGDVFLGEVTGAPFFRESEHSLSNLRRTVLWHKRLSRVPLNFGSGPLDDQAAF
jgi:5-methylcytosine-specific restriction protein B